jgi:hypothetical protein
MIDLANLPFPQLKQLPTGDDIRHSKSIIEQLDQNIVDLERNIKRLRAQLQEAQQKRAAYVSYVSPFRRLPTEVLSEIIILYLQSGGDITVITGICSRLREVALGMAGIWSHIALLPVDGLDDRCRYEEIRSRKRYRSSVYVS